MNGTFSPLMSVQDISKEFLVKTKRGTKQILRAVDKVSFDIYPGEVIGIVGESGCGKSTLGRTILRLYNPDNGQIIWKENDITKIEGRDLKNIKREMQMVFQDPFSSLNPRKVVRDIIGQPLRVNKISTGLKTHQHVQQIMSEVGLDPAHANRFPHQFSGGQRQRISIARALVLKPELVVCDEAVSALDVSIQAQTINLLLDLRDKHGFACLFISHDLSVIEFVSDRIMVMYLGRIVEKTSKDDLIQKPLHPYTKSLLSAFPVSDPRERSSERTIVMGDVPSPLTPPSGCHFHPRCPHASSRCTKEYPPMKDFGNNRQAACWNI